MPVTELTLLHLRPDTSLSSPSFRSALAAAKHTMETYSNNLSTNVHDHHPSANPTHIPTADLPTNHSSPAQHEFHYYSQHEDPSRLYILGSWPSAALHRQSFLPSPENRALVSSLQHDVEVVDGDEGAFELGTAFHVEVEQSSIPLDAPVLAISQYRVTPSNNAQFQEAFDDNRHHLEHFSTYKLAGGWRHEKEEEETGGDGDGGLFQKDVFVVFSGWEDVDHHMKFGESQNYKEYAEIVRWVDEGGFEVRHAVKVDL